MFVSEKLVSGVDVESFRKRVFSIQLTERVLEEVVSSIFSGNNQKGQLRLWLSFDKVASFVRRHLTKKKWGDFLERPVPPEEEREVVSTPEGKWWCSSLCSGRWVRVVEERAREAW